MQRTRTNTKRTNAGYQSPAQKAKAAGSKRSRINVTNFESVTKSLFIPPELNSVLAATGGKVTIELGPGSQSIQITRNGAVIMTEPEVRELSQINQFVKKERKTDVTGKKAGALEALAYRLIAAKKASNKKWEPALIGPNQLTTLRERDAQIKNLGYNLDLIDANKAVASKDAKDYLLRVGSAIRNAIAESALSCLEEGKNEDIYSCAYERNVPRWCVVRLANGKLNNIDATVDLTRLLFPKDFSKGITVTVEETRNKTFVDANVYIYQRSNLLVKCIQSDDIIRALTGFGTAVSLIDVTNVEVNRVMKSVLTLSPVDKDLGRLAKLLEGRGVTMKWSTRGQAGNYKATFLAFSHSFIKAFFGLVKGPDPFNRWWKVCFPNEYHTLIRKDFTGINNSVGHWLGNSRHVHPKEWDDIFSGCTKVARDYVLEAIRTDLGGFTEGRLAALMEDLLGLKIVVPATDEDPAEFSALPNKIDVVAGEREDPTPLAISMTRAMVNEDETGLKKAREKFFATKLEDERKTAKAALRKRGNRDPTMNARGTITAEIEATIRELDEAVAEETIKASLDWLRSFSHPEVRKATAQLLAARFDAYADEENIDVEVNAAYYNDSDNEESDNEAEVKEPPAEL